MLLLNMFYTKILILLQLNHYINSNIFSYFELSLPYLNDYRAFGKHIFFLNIDR